MNKIIPTNPHGCAVSLYGFRNYRQMMFATPPVTALRYTLRVVRDYVILQQKNSNFATEKAKRGRRFPAYLLEISLLPAVCGAYCVLRFWWRGSVIPQNASPKHFVGNPLVARNRPKRRTASPFKDCHSSPPYAESAYWRGYAIGDRSSACP